MLIAVASLLAASLGLAQPSLQVNGVAVSGATTTLVPGVAYAPAGDFARALGADVAVDVGGSRVTLTLGAAIVQLSLVADPATAGGVRGAVLRDGEARPGPAAVWSGAEAFVPVKAAGEALGGRVAFLTDSATVAVVLPRPRIGMRLEGRGTAEHLVFALDAPARVVVHEHAATGVLELRFERADPVAGPPLEGEGFVRAQLEAVRGTAEARVQLTPGVRPRVYLLAAGPGMEVVVALGIASAPAATVATRGSRWVLDAGHLSTAGSSPEAGGEGAWTLAFVGRLVTALASSEIDVVQTRPGPAPVPLEERSALGVGADGFVSVHLADLAPGRVRLYVLDDAQAVDALDRAVRWNAETALERPETDALRRAVLLRLLPDLDLGRAWARALAARLSAAGWSVDGPIGAPVAVLAGAAGRGLLLEMSASDLRDPLAAEIVARALVEAWVTVGAR